MLLERDSNSVSNEIENCDDISDITDENEKSNDSDDYDVIRRPSDRSIAGQKRKSRDKLAQHCTIAN